jgi:hypothetical protein
LLWLISLIFTFSSSQAALTKTGSCKSPNNTARHVALIKQWHLAPKTVTRGFKEKYPQEANQTDIFKAVNEMVKKKKIQLLVAEGCEGEINSEFKASFNGWDYGNLKKESQRRNFERIVSHVPLKIEVRHGNKILTMCGDSEVLIQEGNLRLSNLRGWAGFLTRLNESPHDSEKQKLYGEAAADLLQIPRDTPVDKLIEKIREKLRSEMDALKKSLADRNDKFLQVLTGHEFRNAAVILGGLHAEDLRQKLEAAGIGCDVFEPRGYRREDESLIEKFTDLLK